MHLLHGERSSGGRLPHMAIVIVVFGRNDDLVGNEESRVESDSELSDHGDIGSGLEGLHEGLGARLGDGSKVVDEVSLGHSDSGIEDGEGLQANKSIIVIPSQKWIKANRNGHLTFSALLGVILM